MNVRGETILLVEPSATQALKFKRLLSRLGFFVTVARNAEEAWAAIHSVPPCLVLCDVGVPGVDGYGLCSQIRASAHFSDLPVALLTSFLEPLGAIRALQCGADGLLPRVFEEDALLPPLHDLLRMLEHPGAASSEAVLDGASYPLPAAAEPRALRLLLSSYRVAVQRGEELRQAQDALSGSDQDTVQVPASLPVAAAPPGSPASLRVLLAEDSEVNQRLAVRTIERQGWHPIIAANGEEALRAWEQEPVDLILMDVEMPVMGGLEATRAIRAREAGSDHHVPIFAMTAHDSPEDRQRCRDAGMDACLSKPLQLSAVQAALSEPIAVPADPPPASPASLTTDDVPLSIFDRESALARLGDDEDLLRELTGIFLDEAPALLSQAQESLAAQEAHRLERAAHSLKGSAASIGASALAAAAARLEAAGRGSRFPEAAEELAQVQAALVALSALLQEK